MKIARAEASSTGFKVQIEKIGRRSAWFRWVARVAVILLAFLAGALVFRSGVYRPAWAVVKNLLNGAPQEITLPVAVQEVAVDISDEIRMYRNNGLPTLYIDLPFEGYQRLLAKRAEAIEIGILNTTDEDFVDADVNLQDGPKLEAKLRLKGDWADHLQGDKWSFRIHLKEDGQILSTRQFSVQSPETRNYLYEWAFHKNLFQEGILTTRYEFINVLLNGKLWGIYAFEENFAPELIESQGRRQGVIIRFDEDLMWQNMTTFWAGNFVQDGKIMITNMDSADVTVFQAARIAEDSILSTEAATARELLRAFQAGERPAAEVFDIQQVGRFFALHDLWSACHGIAWHNLRFYYNPVTALLEPVAYDAEPFRWCSTEQSIIDSFTESKLFADPAIRTAYAQELERLTQPVYLASLQKDLAAEHDLIQQALQVEFKDDVHVDWGALKKRARTLQLELQPAQPVRGSYQVIPADETAGAPAQLEIDLVNLTLLPVEVVGLTVNDQVVTLSQNPLELLPVTRREMAVFQPVRATVLVPAGLALDPLTTAIAVQTRLAGLERGFSTPLSGGVMPEAQVVGPAPRQPTLAEALQAHPFLVPNPANPAVLQVTSGVWDVQGDLVLPDDTELFVPAGTVLRFSSGSLFYATGAVHLLGTAREPVLLTSQQTDWAGLIVLNAGKQSAWQYAVVEKTAGINRDGWLMTGGITFYKSDILLDHAILGNNQTEDAINTIHSQFDFRDTHFLNTFADAFDGDFSNGTVTGCLFEDIAGDAVDVSGAVITVADTRMWRITDKGLSVGEHSTATVERVQMDMVGIGIASKDLSNTIIRASRIHQARFSALAAYIKKPVFGPARIETFDLVITGAQQPAVAQKGSTILLNGVEVEAVDLDVERLYQEGILGN